MRIANKSSNLQGKTSSIHPNKEFKNISYSINENVSLQNNNLDLKNNDYSSNYKINDIQNVSSSIIKTEANQNTQRDSRSIPVNDKYKHLKEIMESPLIIKGHNIKSFIENIEGTKLIGGKSNYYNNFNKSNFKFIMMNQIDSNYAQGMNNNNNKDIDDPLYSSFSKNFIFKDPLKNYPLY